MNRRLILQLLGKILTVQAGMMALSLIVALIYGEGDAVAFLITMGLLCLTGLPLWFLSKPQNKELRPKEGFLAVSLIWIVMSLFGALPYIFSGVLPNFFDALFESVSGFSTTGATVLINFSDVPHGIFFWRSFTNWIGGMGVLVLTLALIPSLSGRSSHLLRAESPGPSLSKLVPKLGNSSKLLYLIYMALTILLIIILLLAGMDLYDAMIHGMSTAGTGGFSNQAKSIGGYQSPLIDIIILIFMILFAINFGVYYKALTGGWRESLKSNETRAFLIILAGAIGIIAINILPLYPSFFEALRHAGFQSASVMTTTGFMTKDFDIWPQLSKTILLFLMFIGGCAGSTSGGLKVIRFMVLLKAFLRQIRQTFQPRKIQVIRWEGKALEENTLSQISTFFFAYIGLIALGTVLLATGNQFDLITNFSAALTSVSNVGPGLGGVGPASNFAAYNSFSKSILSFLMLAGRLELFPMLLLFHPAVWRK